MGSAKIVSMNVRPSQVSHLCFEVDGILGEPNRKNFQLGAQATTFDFAAFYAILGGMPTVPGHPARLLYDFLEIQAAVNPLYLVALRAEPRKAALSKAINGRANAYYAKYANAPAIISRMNDYFSPAVIGSKPQRLEVLAGIAQTQWDQLKAAYNSDGRTGVVKTTNSILDSTTQSSGSSSETGNTNQEVVGTFASGTIPNPPQGGASFAGWTFPGPNTVSLQEGSSGENVTSTGSATERQTIVNTDYGYRVPYVEGAAQYERAQISLIDQQFAQFMYGQNLPYLAAVFQNELSAIDSDVYRLQIAYLNSILMSPIPGVVTGIYKNPGDAVRAGEPVVRVENNDVIFLMAKLIYRGPIAIGSPVTVKTTLFDQAGAQTTVLGNVVAVRGKHDDDQWAVIVKCGNIVNGKQVFPLGYHFDYDDTTVTIN